MQNQDKQTTPAPKRELDRLTRDAQGRLVAHLSGEPEPRVDVRVARCFPWSLPDGYVSIRDTEGKELLLFRNMDGLEPATKALVEEELKDKVFNPQIERVVEHKNEFGVIAITADTDRGRVTFQVRDREDIRLLTATRALFRDADGNTYEVSDLSALDPQSRKLIDQYF